MFIDQLLTNPSVEEGVKKELQKAIVIEIGDVANYCCKEAGRPWDHKKDFPNLAPPFDSFFLEFKTPSEFSGLDLSKWGLQSGLLCKSNDAMQEMAKDDFEEIKWGLHITVFQKYMEPHLQTYLGPHWSWVIGIKEDGCLVFDKNDNMPLKYRTEGQLRLAFDESMGTAQNLYELHQYYSWMLTMSFLAISFMHCKNVVLRKEIPPAVQQTPKQKRQRVQPYQPVTYHVLDIEPMKTILKTEGKSNQVGLQRALHICRGHFSTYTEDHKLFGKYAGTFWVPQHVRGSAEAGIATKDYRIKLDK